MKETVKIARTREAIDRHRRLPLYRRIGERLLGKYPSAEDRRSLERYERGPFGRIADDTARALSLTERLVRSSASYLDSNPEPTKENSSVPLYVRSASKEAGLLNQLFERGTVSRNGSSSDEFLGVSLYVPGASRKLAALMVESEGVGICLETSARGSEEKVLKRQDIESLPEDIQQGLESLVASIESNIQNIYTRDQPHHSSNA